MEWRSAWTARVRELPKRAGIELTARASRTRTPAAATCAGDVAIGTIAVAIRSADAVRLTAKCSANRPRCRKIIARKPLITMLNSVSRQQRRHLIRPAEACTDKEKISAIKSIT